MQLLSDRIMVRVGGGWDTLEHFLLEYDPCRIKKITSGIYGCFLHCYYFSPPHPMQMVTSTKYLWMAKPSHHMYHTVPFIISDISSGTLQPLIM